MNRDSTGSHSFFYPRLSRRGQLGGLAALGGVVLLAACGQSGAGEAGQGGATSSGGPVKVVWFASRDTTGFTPTQVQAFNAQSKNIQLDYQEQGAVTQDLHDKFVTVATAKDPSADLVSLDVPYVPEFGAAGWTISVDDVLGADKSKFYKGTLDGATYNGKLYGVPWYNNGPGLFFRKDLLGATPAPKTYDELVATSKKLVTGDVTGFVFQAAQNEGGIISWLELLWGYGGDLVDDKLNVVLDKGTAAADSMKRIVGFVYSDKITPESVLTMKVGADAQNVFVDGRSAFLRYWMTGATGLDADTSKVKGKWDVALLPSQTGAKPGPGCLGTWNLGISKFSKHQKEAAEVVRWLVSPEQVKTRYLGNGSLPVRPATFDEADVKAKFPYADRLKASFESLKPRPVTPYWAQMSADAVGPVFAAAMTRAKTPEQAIKDMADQIKKIVSVK